MYLKIIISIFLFNYVDILLADEYSDASTSNSFTFSQWITFVLSRTIYLILAIMILTCVVYSKLVSKYASKDASNDALNSSKKNLSDTIWKNIKSDNINDSDLSKCNITLGKLIRTGISDFGNSDEEIRLKDELSMANNIIENLKQELHLANVARIELENNLELIDKDKSQAEDTIETERLQCSLELESLKKEHDLAQKKYQQAFMDKENLKDEVTALQREARIAASALRDHQCLQNKFDEAREEIQYLKEQMDGLQSEKSKAVELVSQIMQRANGQLKNISSLENTIPKFLENSKKLSNTQQLRSINNDQDVRNDITTSNVENMNNYDHTIDTNDEEINDDDTDDDNHLVTGSEAFQKFLNNTFFQKKNC